MKTEMIIKIESEKINVELTQEEAKLLYDQLAEFFSAPKSEIIWTPYEPNKGWGTGDYVPIQPYYIGDLPPGSVPIITCSCKST